MIIVIIIIVIIVLALILLYNHLVGLNIRCKNAWAGIDNQLKRRYDLIPNLVEVTKGYANHERETLIEVIKTRNDEGTMNERAKESEEVSNSV